MKTLQLIITLTLFLAGSSDTPHFKFLPLSYAYDALEPYMDAQTMEIHYSRHHQAYYNNLIKAVDGTEMATMSIENILADISKYPETIRNNGGGYYNHMLFWENMTPPPTGKTFQSR